MLIKKENRRRGVDYSPHEQPKLHRQEHDMEFIFKDYKNNMFELGWTINVIEDKLIRVRITTTDIYEINNQEIEATEDQIKQVIDETFQVAKSKYNEEKNPLSLAEQLKYSLDDKMPQILQELTRILNEIHEFSTLENRSRQP